MPDRWLAAAALRNHLVVKILRMVRLREKEPSLGDQPDVLNQERAREQRRRREREPAREQQQRKWEGQRKEDPLHRAHERRPPAVKELARVERAAHRSLRLLLDL